jgi:hypothetical protein
MLLEGRARPCLEIKKCKTALGVLQVLYNDRSDPIRREKRMAAKWSVPFNSDQAFVSH